MQLRRMNDNYIAEKKAGFVLGALEMKAERTPVK